MTRRFKHIETGSIYEFREYAPIKINHRWESGVIYVKIETLQVFVRTEANFFENFIEVE